MEVSTRIPSTAPSAPASFSQFTMDPGLLVSVIKSQAGTLSKAILEGVMNSIDAGSPRVDVTLTDHSFTIRDTGRGFRSESEIREWFGRFGTPHKEGDAIFGRFRMGRGQMFAFAKTVWRSGRFVMTVDLEKDGMGYKLESAGPAESVRGCVIEASLYKPLSAHRLTDTLTELRKFVAYAPRPVYVNGELFGGPASRLKSWTYENDDAWFKVVPSSSELEVYNQGIFVESVASWRTGMGGVIVSKAPLMVNFARNAILEDQCQVWGRITRGLEAAAIAKLSTANKLEDNERRFLARRVEILANIPNALGLSAKILTDPSGKHIELSRLKDFQAFVYFDESTPLACSLHGVDGVFVVTGSLLTRFGARDIHDWLRRLDRIPGLLNPQWRVVESNSPELERFQDSLGLHKLLDVDGLAARERAAFACLSHLNRRLSENLIACGVVSESRELRIGRIQDRKKGARSKAAQQAVAWTDGKTYITANAKYLSNIAKGLDGIHWWAMTLVHEYMHDTDDSESHAHGEVFFRKFHDTVCDSPLKISSLCKESLRVYLEALKAADLPRPWELTRQLKGV